MTAYYNEIDPYAAQWLRNLIAAGHIAPGDVDERSIEEVQADDLRGYDQVHMFAGIGGWSLALRLAGWDDARPVWTGSCPCQPFSIAGKGRGAADERHLWPVFYRLIGECRPPVVFGEQVASPEVVGTDLETAFVVAVQRGEKARANKLAKRLVAHRNFHFHQRWIDGVQANLETSGYSFGYKVLGAHSVGAPHIRQRLWWVADANTTGRREQRGGGLLDGERATLGDHPDGRGEVRGLGNTSSEGLAQRVGDRRIQRETMGASPWETAERTSWISCADGKARRIEPGLEPLADGIPNRVGRVRAYGNAIVPQDGATFVRAHMEVAA